MAAGLAVYGMATYGYLGAAGRGLADVSFAPLSVMWTLLNAVGIGLFLPFEQEVARRTAVARATGTGNAAAVRRALLGAGGLLLLVAAVTAAAGRAIAEHLFGGSTALAALMVAAMAGMAAGYVARGLLSGNGRFGRYGAQLAADGVLRVVGAVVLAAAGVRAPAAYAALLLLAPLLAVVITTPSPRSLLTPGSQPNSAGGAVSLGLLVVASLLSQALANAGTVVVQLLAGPDDAAAAGQFTAALVVARIPLFAFAAVQAVLLPALAGMVGARDAAGLQRRSLTVIAWTAGLGALGTAGIWVLGPWLVPLLFGSGYATGRGLITAIAGSGALFMLAQVLAQVLLALGAERHVVVGWGAGLVALVLATTVGSAVDLRAATALVVGSAVALALLAVCAVTRARQWRRGSDVLVGVDG